MKSTLFILKKQSLRYFISGTLAAILLLSVFIYSCKHEVLESNEIITVDEAQQWYEALPNSSVKLKSGHKSNSVELKNVWESARAYKNDSLGIIEVNIMSKGKIGFLHPRSKEAMDNTGNQAYSNSLTKLVVKKSKRTNRIEGFLMTLVPTPEYMESHNFDLNNNVYLKWQSDYSGMVLYHSISGEFVNGWEFEDGKVVKTCFQVSEEEFPINTRLKTRQCQYITVSFLEEVCTDWYVNGKFSWTSCKIISSEVLRYKTCIYDGEKIPSGGYTSTTTTTVNKDIIGDLDNYPCGAQALQKMMESGTSLGQILCNVFGNGPEVNVTFRADATLPIDVDGQLSPKSLNNNFIVDINTYVLNNSSQPYILATLLHEGLHAYFKDLSNHDPNFKARYPCLSINVNGEMTFVYDKEHEYMTKYVMEIADVLRDAYPSLSQMDAEALSWGGLQRTHAYRLNNEALDKMLNTETSKTRDAINQAHKNNGCGKY